MKPVTTTPKNWDNDYSMLSHTYSDSGDTPSELAMKVSSSIIKSIIKKYLPDIKSPSVIEIGCGGARNSIDLALAGYNVTAVDFSEEAVRLAKYNASQLGASLAIEQQDMFCHKSSDGTFDVVITTGLLEHFENIDDPIKAFRSYSKPGSLHIHIIIPKKFSSYNIINTVLYVPRFLKRLVRGQLSGIFKKSFRDFPHYENSYTRYFYAQRLECSGFYPLVTIASGSLLPFLSPPRPLDKLFVRLFRPLLCQLMLFSDTRTGNCWHFFSPVFTIVCIAK